MCGESGHYKKDFPKGKEKKAKFHYSKVEEQEDKVRTSFEFQDFDSRESTGNEPLIIDFPEEEDTSNSELFFVDVQIGGQCIPAMIDIGALKNFMSKSVQEKLGMKSMKMVEPMSCQFSDGGFSLITKKVSRVEVGLTKVGRDFICKEEFLVLMSTRIELVFPLNSLEGIQSVFIPKRTICTFLMGKAISYK